MITEKKKELIVRVQKILRVSLCLCPIMFAVVSCKNNSQKLTNTACLIDVRPCLSGKAKVYIETNRGLITLELNGESAPVTSGNFLDLINKGVYKNTTFHRVIKKPYPFIIQGGDLLSRESFVPNNEYGNEDFVGSVRTEPKYIPLELKLKNEKLPRYNTLIDDPSEISKLELIHKRGSIAMARSEFLGSASSQFYIALRSLPELDGRYSVFGRVVSGLDVLNEIQEGDLVEKISFTLMKKPR